MKRPNDSRGPRSVVKRAAGAAVALLACIGWSIPPHAAESATVGAGRVRAIAIDPITPATLYAGTECSVLLKSIDGGDTWQAVATDVPRGLQAFTALAIDPTTPTTLYAGGNSSVLKSTDAGSSWRQATAGLPSPEIRAITIDPAFPNTVYAGTAYVTVKSTDGGATWADVNFPGVPVFDLTIPGNLYAVGGLGLPKSTDNGDTWLEVGLTNRFVTGVVIDPTSPTTLYATIYEEGVLKSTDGGSNWVEVHHGFGVWSLATHPTAAGPLYAGIRGVERTTDGGATWAPTGLVESVICGDGVTACDEQCDDGNRVNGDGCEADCTLPRCGNGIVDLGEECDDGNLNPSDGCTNTCTICGNGIVTSPETCDDGNRIDTDACTNDCRLAGVTVGDGTAASCTETPLDAALAGGRMVTFNCGGAPVTITLTHQKTISSETTVDGGGVITLDGNDAVLVFWVAQEGALNLKNLTIARGHGCGSEGCGEGGPAGAIANSGTVTVTDSTFSGNHGDSGGAILNRGTLTVTNSTFAGNFGAYGGAIANGDVYVGGTLTVTSSTFSGNGGGMGGAIFIYDGAVAVTNSTFSGNSAVVDGGAVANHGSVTVTNSTFWGNNAPGAGGAIDNLTTCGDTHSAPCLATLRNAIVANSTQGGNCVGTIADGGHNLDDDGSCGFNSANGSLSNTNPMLEPAGLADNGGPTQTIAVEPGSPVIDAGDQSVCAAAPVNNVDQRGYVRPGIGSINCSIGAYEFNSPGPPAGCAGDCTLDGTVTVDEVITLVSIALGATEMSECEIGDDNGDSQITIDEVIAAVNSVLRGCASTPLRLTTVFDNTACDARLQAEAGFAALLERHGHRLLFDAGGNRGILTQNMAVLGIEPASIDAVALSHFHSDHYAGLPALEQTDVHLPVYIPPSFPQAFRIGFGSRFELLDTSPGQEVRPGMFITGEMVKTGVGIYEQSLVVPTEKGLVIVTGCAHQGIVELVTRAKEMFDVPVYLVMGGFHLLEETSATVQAIIDDFRRLGVQRVAPTHCTGEAAIAQFATAYGDHYVQGGAGRVLVIGGPSAED